MAVPISIANATSIQSNITYCFMWSVVCVYIITRGRCFLKFDCNLGDHSLRMDYPRGKTVSYVLQVVYRLIPTDSENSVP